MIMISRLDTYLRLAELLIIYAHIVIFPCSAAGPHTIINGKEVLNFASANFLGLIGHEKIIVRIYLPFAVLVYYFLHYHMKMILVPHNLRIPVLVPWRNMVLVLAVRGDFMEQLVRVLSIAVKSIFLHCSLNTLTSYIISRCSS